MVLGISSRPAPTRPSVDDEEYEPVRSNYDQASDGFNAPDITPQSSFRQQMSSTAPSPVKQEAVVDDDDALSYFARLAEE